MRLSAGEGTPGLAAAFPVEKVNAIKGKKKKKKKGIFFIIIQRVQWPAGHRTTLKETSALALIIVLHFIDCSAFVGRGANPSHPPHSSVSPSPDPDAGYRHVSALKPC